MRSVAVLVVSGVLMAGCNAAGADLAASAVAQGDGARAGDLVLKMRLNVADAPGSEPIATGVVLDGSTLGGTPLCAGGTVLDSHGSPDHTVWLIAEAITCPEGVLRLEYVPDEPQGLQQTGTWTLIGGTGAFDGLRGSGTMDIQYDADDDSLAHVTSIGTVTH